jgi:alpha-beta hydrolase superfamily lysophospholipase
MSGATIAFTKTGSGPPLIIVDGAFCYRENGPASELASVLAQHFTVFTYDRRGRGDSGDTAPYAVEREIDDFRAVAREAGATPFVFGISSGGALILQAVASGGGEKSPKELRDAVAAVANALPNGQSRFLSGQDHNISSRALAPGPL